jgi:putative hydrolase of the HAD superfamily
MTDSPRRRPLPGIDTWIIDLDNTLYAARYNLFAQVDVRIGAFISRLLGLDPTAARRLQKDYFHQYGTTLKGLMDNHCVDPHEFLDFVHEIDVTAIPPAPALGRALGAIDGRKLIFTNGSAAHADNVMGRLGVARHFEGVFDIVAAGFVPKPNRAAYDMLVERHGVEPRTAVMVEDIARNLEPAREMGMTTVWVRTADDWGREGSDGGHIDHIIDDLAEWLTKIVELPPGG